MKSLGIEKFVKLEYSKKSSQELLNSGVDVLVGVNKEVVNTLKQLHIYTVFDLANNSFFTVADKITTSADEGLLPEKMADKIPPGAIDEAYKNVPLKMLAKQSILTLKGVGEKTFDHFTKLVDAKSISDLANWPPYIAAKNILECSAPLHGGISHEADPDAPSELLPVARKYPIEKHYYHKIYIDESFNVSGNTVASRRRKKDSHIKNKHVELNQPIDLTHGLLESYFTSPFFGAYLTFEQSWTPEGLSLGNLVHSLALAPGESTRIALIDWHRKETGMLAEDTTQYEKLQNELRQSSSINEIARGVIKETQEGKSKTDTESYSWSSGETSGFLESFFGGAESSGEAFSGAETISVSSSTGRRDTSMESMQDIMRSTQQNASSVRSRRAVTIKEVQQTEKEELRTRIVTNYNHSHALSVHYYEVVQIYKTMLDLVKCERVVFIPMQHLDFDDPKILKKFRSALKAGARNESELKFISRYTGEVKVVNNALQSGARDQFFFLDEDAVLESVEMSGASTSPKPKWDVKSITITIGDENHKFENPTPAKYNGFNFILKNELICIKEIKKIDVTYHYLGEGNKFYAQSYLRFRSGNKISEYIFYHHLRRQAIISTESVVTVECDFFVDQFSNILVDDRDYFNAVAWKSLSESQLARILAPYSFKGESLVGNIDFPPLGIYGNCLVFKYWGKESTSWQQWKQNHIDSVLKSNNAVLNCTQK